MTKVEYSKKIVPMYRDKKWWLQEPPQKKSRVLVFEASNSIAGSSEVIESVRATTAEEAVTCESATHRTTPVVTAAAHSGERTIAVAAVTGNGKLHCRTCSRSTIGNT